MSEETKTVEPPPALVEKVDVNEAGRVEIVRGDDLNSLLVYMKNPEVASILRKMAPGNYTRDSVNKIYHAILAPVKDKKGEPDPKATHLFETRPAAGKATTMFQNNPEFSFTEKPSTILLSNPDALAEGFTLTYKVEQPVPLDVLKRYAKYVMDGWNEIITNAKPFKMSWIMSKDE